MGIQEIFNSQIIKNNELICSMVKQGCCDKKIMIDKIYMNIIMVKSLDKNLK